MHPAPGILLTRSAQVVYMPQEKLRTDREYFMAFLIFSLPTLTGIKTKVYWSLEVATLPSMRYLSWISLKKNIPILKFNGCCEKRMSAMFMAARKMMPWKHAERWV